MSVGFLGSGSIFVGVNYNVQAAPNCNWTAVSNVHWINIIRSSGTGNGTFSFTVLHNSGDPRVSTIRVNGQIFTVKQNSGCSYYIPGDFPTAYLSANSTNNGSFTVITYRASMYFSCSLNVSTDSLWITIRYIKRSENLKSYVVRFGTSGDIPAPADYDGDGKTDLAIYRPSTGYWWYAASAMNGQHRTGRFGISTDIPLPSAYVR